MTTELSKLMDDLGAGYERLRADVDDLHRKANDRQWGGFQPGGDGTAEQRDHLDCFKTWLRNPGDMELKARLQGFEKKAALGTSDATGGALVPEILVNRIFRQVQDQVVMRQLASVYSSSSGSLKFPVSTGRDTTSTWVGEGTSRSATTEPGLISRVPTVGTVYALVSASEELVYDSGFDIAGWLAGAAADTIANAEGAAFISGNGTNRPKGILNTAPVADLDASPAPSTEAIKYVATGAAGAFQNDRLTSPAGDPTACLVDAVMGLQAQYRRNASWVMNSATAAILMKWRDADGRMIWNMSLADSSPDRLLGYPVFIDEEMPDVGSNTHPILFGDFRRGYMIVDCGGVRITYDDNISSPGFHRWYIRRRVGGIIADQRAIVAIKAAAS